MDTPAPQPLPATEAQPPTRDAPGCDLGAGEWTPVPRRPRADGWSHTLQRQFIKALAATGSVTDAARVVRKSVNSCYRLRRAPGAEGFSAAWAAALAESGEELIDIALDRAINGSEESALGRDGNALHSNRRINDRLLMFLLRAHHPARYRPDAALPAAAPRAAAPATLEQGAFAEFGHDDVVHPDIDAFLAALSSLSARKS